MIPHWETCLVVWGDMIQNQFWNNGRPTLGATWRLTVWTACLQWPGIIAGNLKYQFKERYGTTVARVRNGEQYCSMKEYVLTCELEGHHSVASLWADLWEVLWGPVESSATSPVMRVHIGSSRCWTLQKSPTSSPDYPQHPVWELSSPASDSTLIIYVSSSSPKRENGISRSRSARSRSARDAASTTVNPPYKDRVFLDTFSP